MKEGKIIKFPDPEENPNREKEVRDDEDGGKIVELPRPREQASASIEQDALRGLAGEFLEKAFGEISLAILDKKFLEIRRYIASLEGFRRSNETRTLRGDLINGLTDVELADLLTESNEAVGCSPLILFSYYRRTAKKIFKKTWIKSGEYVEGGYRTIF